MELHDGRIGLIDFGQVQRVSDQNRLDAARIVCALANDERDAVIAQHMGKFGFETKDKDDDATMASFARLFFDCDYESKALGFATPQLWFAHLMAHNALINIPESSGTCNFVLFSLDFHCGFSLFSILSNPNTTQILDGAHHMIF